MTGKCHQAMCRRTPEQLQVNMELVSSALSLLGGIIGIGLLYIAVFLYDDEHGQMQNRLEHWWLKMQDYSEMTVGRHVVFARRVCTTLGEHFDRLFGESVFSIRSVAVSSAYSLAAFGFVFFLLLLYLFAIHFADTAPAPVPYFAFAASVTYPVAMLAAIAWCVFFLELMHRCITQPSYGYLTLVGTFAAAPLWFFTSWCWYAAVEPPAPTAQLVVRALIATAALACAVLSDWLLIGTTRYCLRACADFRSFPTIMLSLAANLAIAMIFFAVPAWVFLGTLNPFSGIASLALTTEFAERLQRPVAFFATLASLNVTVLIPTLAFVSVSVTLILHRIAWRLINRPIYAVAEMSIAKRKKLCASVAITLLVPSVSGFGTWGKWLMEII
ncbi:hypothetical protein CA12_28690 [Alienimonas californiensis]|uniref:Uncharacterized protein n=2 Tax=Alienimonas californiensis TaxID=2527989 RepID=A0A517PBM8_9PLAN|nr:hypothetical protein CA12_28690 [Alienimonas californiensis]